MELQHSWKSRTGNQKNFEILNKDIPSQVDWDLNFPRSISGRELNEIAEPLEFLEPATIWDNIQDTEEFSAKAMSLSLRKIKNFGGSCPWEESTP